MLRCSGRNKYTASKALCVLTQGDPHPWPNRSIGFAMQTILPALPWASQFPGWKWEALLQAILNFPNRLSEPRATISLSCELIICLCTVGELLTPSTSFALGVIREYLPNSQLKHCWAEI